MNSTCIRLALTAALCGGVTVSAQNVPLVPAHRTASSANPPAVSVVARVNGAALSQRDLQHEMQSLFPYSEVHKGRVPGQYAADVRRKALQQIIFDELVHQEALRRKMTVSTAIFSDILKQAKSRFPSQAEYESYAAQEYGSVRGFEKQLRRGILIALLVDREITQKARMTDAQVRQVYSANKERFLKPESIWVQSISMNIPEKATPVQRAQARKRAEIVLPQAKAAKTFEAFGQLAEKYSEDDWRIMMGDHLLLHRGRLPEAVENVAFRLKTGESSEIIETSEAFVIVRVNGKQASSQIPFSQVSKSLREDLEKARLADLRAQFEQKLRSRYKVEELK
ncbi:MAG: peptidyl-prolyl cis-trans isomerase [Acidobacteria bacterium]|nr:peptidyl-prolyl cis-trans isomerase [Acidobacteriota bacterium]